MASVTANLPIALSRWRADRTLHFHFCMTLLHFVETLLTAVLPKFDAHSRPPIVYMSSVVAAQRFRPMTIVSECGCTQSTMFRTS